MIKLKLAKAHQIQALQEDVKKERDSIENYINEKVQPIAEGGISLIPIKGLYHHKKRTMVLVAAFVNTIDSEIIGIKGRLKCNVVGTTSPIISFDFPESFVGVLRKNEGFPIHFEIPIKGLDFDIEVEGRELNCELDNIEVLMPEIQSNKSEA